MNEQNIIEMTSTSNEFNISSSPRPNENDEIIPPSIIPPLTTLPSKPLSISPPRKIGKNIICTCCCTSKKYVFGISQSIILILIIQLLMFITVAVWFFSTYTFYHPFLYVLGLPLYLICSYQMLMCFFVEPGIIPRNHKDFQIHNVTPLSKDDEHNEMKPSPSNPQIPSIFKERYCSTCNIIRPPKASHCSKCDNCILDLDHNCVALRNHKHFFIFLASGTLISIYISILNILHAFYVYVLYHDKIITHMFTGNKVLFIIGVILLVIALIYASCGVMDIGCLLTPALIGYGMLVYLFYRYKPEGTPSYVNPFSVVSLIGSVSLGIFAGVNFANQMSTVMSGYTTKQTYSINKEYLKRMDENQEQIDEEYLRVRTMREKMRNLYMFLKRGKPDSLINSKRDL